MGPLVIRWRWYRLHYLFLAAFCVFWDLVPLGWYAVLLTKEGPIDIGAALFPLLHLAAGVAVTYITIAGFVNHTEIKVDSALLTVTHGPLWWPAHPSLNARDFTQLYVARRVHKNKNSTTTTYEVMALDRENTAVSVIKGLHTIEEAKFLEQSIEQKLAIKGRAVEGEA